MNAWHFFLPSVSGQLFSILIVSFPSNLMGKIPTAPVPNGTAKKESLHFFLVMLVNLFLGFASKMRLHLL